jgi:hypothetical protein
MLSLSEQKTQQITSMGEHIAYSSLLLLELYFLAINHFFDVSPPCTLVWGTNE